MSEKTPPLSPIFRSENQLRLLGVLFGFDRPELSITDLAEHAGVDERTTGREVRRLARYDIVTIRKVGRVSLVSASWEVPWAQALAQLLAQTIGVPAVLADELRSVEGEISVFGSWAARYHGEPGPPPRDVDVLVVADDVDFDEVNTSCRRAEDRLGVEVNPTIRSAREWAHAAPDSFLGQIKAGPLAAIRGNAHEDSVT